MDDIVTKIDEIKNPLDVICSYKIEDLVRKDQLGESFSFKGIENEISEIIELCKKVKQIELTTIPYNEVASLSNWVVTIKNSFTNIQSFDVNTNNPKATRDSLITTFRGLFNRRYLIIQILMIDHFNNSDSAKLTEKLNQIGSEIGIKAAQTDKKMRDALENVQSIATEAGVSKHATLFSDEAEEHIEKAKYWIGVSIALLVIIIGFAYLSYINFSPVEKYEIIHFSITKVIILSTLFYALAISNKNYKAHRHNAITNKHRQNALSTFETFSGSEHADEQTKNAVLLEATHTIFGNQQSGYLTTENNNDSNKIIEIFKSATKKDE